MFMGLMLRLLLVRLRGDGKFHVLVADSIILLCGCLLEGSFI